MCVCVEVVFVCGSLKCSMATRACLSRHLWMETERFPFPFTETFNFCEIGGKVDTNGAKLKLRNITVSSAALLPQGELNTTIIKVAEFAAVIYLQNTWGQNIALFSGYFGTFRRQNYCFSIRIQYIVRVCLMMA